LALAPLLFLLISAFAPAEAFGNEPAVNCPAPALYPVQYHCDGAVQLSWAPVPGVTQYTLEIDDQNNATVVNFLNTGDTSVTVLAGVLSPGEDYSFALTADCGNSTLTSTQGTIEGDSIQLPPPTLSVIRTEGTSCPSAFDGSFEVVLQADTCSALFDIAAAGDTLTVMAGDTAQFTGLSVGDYDINLLLNDADTCNYRSSCVDSIKTAAQIVSADSEAPQLSLMDASGATPPDSLTVSPPEGSCGFQLTWLLSTTDNCGMPAVSAEVATFSSNALVTPGGSAELIFNGTSYALEIYAATGTNLLTISSEDADGNATVQEYIIEVPDLRAPIIQGPTDMLVETPSCDSDTPVNWSVSVNDNCDLEPSLNQVSGPASGSNLAAGAYTVVYEAADDYGNTSTYSFDITVEQGDSPAPIVDISGNTDYTISPCEAEAFVLFSGNIMDCNISAGDNVASQIAVEGAPLDVTYTSVQAGYAYFELTGTLSEGTYGISLSYKGTEVQNALIVVKQEEDQPASIAMPGNLNFTLPACMDTLPVDLNISLTDDCDSPIDTNELVVNLNGAPLAFSPELSSSGQFVYELLLSGEEDGAELEVLYTDGAGNSTAASATLSVTDEVDDTPPMIIHPKQNIHKTLAACAESEEQVCFQAYATDNCSPDAPLNVLVTDADGNLLPVSNPQGQTYCLNLSPGQYTVTLQSSDEAGNEQVENFSIQIFQPAPPPTNLACNDQINISLSENCNRQININMLLEGSFGCLSEEDFLIHIEDNKPQNDNVVDGHGTFVYEVELAAGLEDEEVPGFEPCWGYIKAMDKRDPILSIPADTDEGTVSVDSAYSLNGTIDAGDAALSPAIYVCLLDLLPGDGERFYEVQPLQVEETGYYTLLAAKGFAGSRGGVALFRDAFSPLSACGNLIAADTFPADRFVDGPLPVLSLRLEESVPYYLLTTTEAEAATGDYEYLVHSWGDGAVGTFAEADTAGGTDFTAFETVAASYTLPLRCSDLGALLNQASSQSITGFAEAVDNCGAAAVTIEDTYEENGDCSPTVVERRFTATDSAGNAVSGIQEIQLRPAPAAQAINFPPAIAQVSCDEAYASTANGNPAAEVTGYPFVNTVNGPVELSELHCNLSAAFSDGPRANTCSGSYKFTRTWTIIDWCHPSNNLNFQQTVKVGDFSAPIVTAPDIDNNGDGQPDTPVFSTIPSSCSANFEVPLPEVQDNCSSWRVETQILEEVPDSTFDENGQLTEVSMDTAIVRELAWNAPSRMVTGIPVGNYLLRYEVRDDCNNKTTAFFPMRVEDRAEPVAVCDNAPVISLGGSDYGRLFAVDLDDGSWDNCGIERLEIRRGQYDADSGSCGSGLSDWGEFIEFNCCDVGQAIMVELSVVDEAGNTNGCMTQIVPEEKTRPTCQAPESISITCADLPPGFDGTDLDQLEALFGAPEATDNCAATVEELSPIVELECGAGAIMRRFRATDDFGNQSINTCQQLITIEESHNFEIRFPADAELICSQGNADSVFYNTIGCDLLAVNFEDEVFDASGETCQIVERTWKVINWCQYDGVSDPFVVGRDVDCDLQMGDEAVWVLHRPDGYTYIDRDQDESENNNVPTASENLCQGFDDYWQKADYEGGYYQYRQRIEVVDDLAPQLSFEQPAPYCSTDNEACEAAVSYTFTVDESCLPGTTLSEPEGLEVQVTLDAFADGFPDDDLSAAGLVAENYPDFEISGDYPIGNHRFIVELRDGCGNESSYLLPFEVADCAAPSPPCLNGIAVELDPHDADGDGTIDGGIGDVWADDFIIGNPFDCSGELTYSINRIGDPVNIDSTGIYFSCADTGLVEVEVHTWDTLGNRSTCETFLFVQDNDGVCTGEFVPTATTAGLIETETGAQVEEVEVSLSGSMGDWMVTGPDGSFSFEGLSPGQDYTLTPMRDGDDLNGVSTYDMILMSKHILGVSPLESPYQIIAADINRSGSITTLDMIALRKLILGDALELADNTSWRFIDANYVFPNPADPWEEEFPEIMNLNNLPANGVSNADFVAIKVGDLSLNAQASNLTGLETRSYDGTFHLRAEDRLLKKGEQYHISIAGSTADMGQLLGYQGTMRFDRKAVSLVDIFPGRMGEEHFGFAFLDEGYITMSWNEEPGQESAEEEELFTLVLEAREATYLSHVLSFGSRVTPAEAYEAGGSRLNVAFAFDARQPEQPSDDGFELHQNQPNPFRGETQISFDLPEPGPVQLIISDIAGKVVKVIEVQGVRGYNALTLSHRELPAMSMGGVLQYSLRAGQHFATKRMMILAD